jgi:hypothetical protein
VSGNWRIVDSYFTPGDILILTKTWVVEGPDGQVRTVKTNDYEDESAVGVAISRGEFCDPPPRSATQRFEQEASDPSPREQSPSGRVPGRGGGGGGGGTGGEGLSSLFYGFVMIAFVVSLFNFNLGVSMVTTPVIWVLESVFGPIQQPSARHSQTGPITAANGNVVGVRVRDFLRDEDTYEDPVNPGYYYLRYPPQGNNPPYHIVYIAQTSYFNVVLYEEPIGDSRRAAEEYLRGKLGLKQTEMCGLNYTVGTPNSVNSAYASMNLGFSFCTGAVRLP